MRPERERHREKDENREIKQREVRMGECLTANSEVATVLGSRPASSDTAESEGRQMKQC